MQRGGYGTFPWIGMIVVKKKKSQVDFSLFVLSRDHKDIRHVERKDLNRRPTEHVYMGNIG